MARCRSCSTGTRRSITRPRRRRQRRRRRPRCVVCARTAVWGSLPPRHLPVRGVCVCVFQAVPCLWRGMHQGRSAAGPAGQSPLGLGGSVPTTVRTLLVPSCAGGGRRGQHSRCQEGEVSTRFRRGMGSAAAAGLRPYKAGAKGRCERLAPAAQELLHPCQHSVVKSSNQACSIQSAIATLV